MVKMRIKTAFLIGISIFFIENLMAQTKPEMEPKAITASELDARPRYEMGVNGSAFFKQLLNFSGTKPAVDSNNITETPYYFTAKMRSKRGYWRLGLGATLSAKSESSGKLADTKTVRNADYQLRLGYEWQRKLTDKWLFYYGVDVLGRYKEKALIADSGFDLVNISETTIGTGIAPIAGIRFQLWQNIALSTETAVRYRFSNFKEKTSFSINPDFNEQGKIVDLHELDFLPPTSIYITILF
jgi:hypothetical protein